MSLPALVPQSLHEAMELADQLASSRLIPKDFKGSPPDILSAISLAQRWQMDIWAVMEHVSIIQGKRFIDGQMAGALINALANVQRPIVHTYRGEGDDRTVTASATFNGETKPREIEVRLGDARTPNSAWKKQPDQQLAYTANRVWGRRNCPQLFVGIHFKGEHVIELDATEVPTTELPQLAQPIAPEADPDTGEIGPRNLAIGDQEEWLAWGQRFMAAIGAAESEEEVAKWREHNAAELELMATDEPKLFEKMMLYVHKRADKLKPKEKAKPKEEVPP
jgi:hypothetical protein